MVLSGFYEAVAYIRLLRRPGAFEDFDSRTGHINAVIFYAPVQCKLAAR